MRSLSNRLWNIRLEDEARERWEKAAERAGMKLTAFVRGSVEASIIHQWLEVAGKEPAEPVLVAVEGDFSPEAVEEAKLDALEAVVSDQPEPEEGFSPHHCPRAQFHRKGFYCKTCGIYPR